MHLLQLISSISTNNSNSAAPLNRFNRCILKSNHLTLTYRDAISPYLFVEQRMANKKLAAIRRELNKELSERKLYSPYYFW